MSWHAAQVGFVITTIVVVIALVLTSAHLLSSVVWTHRWPDRRRSTR